MSFKPWLFLALIALISGVQSQQSSTSPSNDDLVDSEIIPLNSSHSKVRKECWKMGGVTYNREVLADQVGTRISALKKVKSTANITVYNFGSQFKSSDYAGGSQEATTWMVFEGDKSRWNEKQDGDHYCQRILDYKCLNDMIINSAESLARAKELACREFHGDLVLSGLDYKLKNTELDFIGSIEKIRGRLIIIGLLSDNPLNFAKLVEVGKHQRNRTRPSILIDANSLVNVTFPQLKTISFLKDDQNILKKCKGGSSKGCVHFGHNVRSTNIEARETMFIEVNRTIINKKNKYTEVEIENDKINDEPIPKEEKSKIHSEDDMKKRGWAHSFDNWSDQAWKANYPVYGGLAAVCGVGIAILLVILIRNDRKRLRVDAEDIEKRDDQEFIEIDEDYFKVDNNNNNNSNNNKNSAMDDLGSL